MTTAVIICLIALAVLKLTLNTVTKFSTADETMMRVRALRVALPGYSHEREVERWPNDAYELKFPGMTRFAALFLYGVIYRITGSCSARVITAVSTLAGIAIPVLCWAIAHRVAPGSELAAVVLTGLSPLVLHLGRRALLDAQTCALALAVIVAGLYGQMMTAAVLLALMVAVKETTVTHVPTIAVCLWMAGVPEVSIEPILFGGGCLYVTAFFAIGGGTKAIKAYRLAVRASKTDEYGRYQEGGIHRLLIDLALISPVALSAASRSTLWVVMIPALILLAVHAALPVAQAIRMTLTADVLMRLAAAQVIAHSAHPIVWLCVAAAVDVALFRKVFPKVGGVYDPITANLTAALRMQPQAIEENFYG